MAAPCSLWMALVLLGALGVLPAPALAGFQLDQFLGRWFAVGLASNASWFLEQKDSQSMCLVVVAPAEPEQGDGVLNLTTSFPRREEYETRSMLLSPTNTPGHYTYTSPFWGNTQDLWVEETDSEYALLYTVCAGENNGFHLATLYSRTETPEDAVKDKFTAFAAAKGFPEEDILFPPYTGEGPPRAGSGLQPVRADSLLAPGGQTTLSSGMAYTGGPVLPHDRGPQPPSNQHPRGARPCRPRLRRLQRVGAGAVGTAAAALWGPNVGAPRLRPWALGVRPPVCSGGWGGLGVMELGMGERWEGRGGSGPDPGTDRCRPSPLSPQASAWMSRSRQVTGPQDLAGRPAPCSR
ncbi:LOW QUALITY PROTEIN: prostaglandin-H2 D-isomerase [Pipistrellus kuhlii]|uniref:LOW QUALITY PROTEIN: prostaglandin-H2 D-isomerase n=1 Tax=Pipistrellus kuhlii TaxID=59472 RepID=UPI001E27432F|nr:LOW QUALITY PROTEIN: prostaglandin-H2 D-isomerase [Pipistrellus kuhlii]